MTLLFEDFASAGFLEWEDMWQSARYVVGVSSLWLLALALPAPSWERTSHRRRASGLEVGFAGRVIRLEGTAVQTVSLTVAGRQMLAAQRGSSRWLSRARRTTAAPAVSGRVMLKERFRQRHARPLAGRRIRSGAV